jgi:Mn-containing catalase
VDGGDGTAAVVLSEAQQAALDAMAARTLSDPDADPMTGADLGAGPGAGATTGETETP